MNWYCKPLAGSVGAYARKEAIKKTFQQTYNAAGEPEDMALFARYDLRENLTKLYFTPGASATAEAFHAVPCQKPRPEGLGLLAGDDHAWEHLLASNGPPPDHEDEDDDDEE